jgi:hypothetical protein
MDRMQEFTHIFHILITLKCQCIAMVCAMVRRALLSIWNNWMVKLKDNQKSKLKQVRRSWNSGQSLFCKETFLQLKMYFASSRHLELKCGVELYCYTVTSRAPRTFKMILQFILKNSLRPNLSQRKLDRRKIHRSNGYKCCQSLENVCYFCHYHYRWCNYFKSISNPYRFLSVETIETWIVYVCHSEGDQTRQNI